VRNSNYENFKESFLELVFSRDFLLSLILSLGFLIFTGVFWGILAPFFIAFILAYLLNPMVEWLHHKLRRLGRAGAVFLVFSLILTVIFLAVIPFLLQLGSNIHTMANEISSIDYAPVVAKASSQVRKLKNIAIPAYVKEPVDQAIDYVFENVDQYQQKIANTLRTINSWIGKGFKKLGGILIRSSEAAFKKTMDVVLITILLIYLLYDFPKIYPLFQKMIPPGYRPWVQSFMEATDHTLWNFIRGQGIVAFVFGVLMSLGLWILGIKFWFVIGPLSGMANLVPFLGIIFGLGPALLLGLYQGAVGAGAYGALTMTLKVLALFTVVQFIDGNLVQPKVVGESVGLHPVVILLALLLGAGVAGIQGMLFAVPVAAVLKVLALEIYHVLYEDKSILLTAKA
jgi:predicted PurR-regulated permease PerM